MDLECLETADQVFDALDGRDGISALTESKPNAVSNWRAFGHFPANTCLVMLRALNERGKTAPPSLWRMKGFADDATNTTTLRICASSSTEQTNSIPQSCE